MNWCHRTGAMNDKTSCKMAAANSGSEKKPQSMKDGKVQVTLMGKQPIKCQISREFKIHSKN